MRAYQQCLPRCEVLRPGRRIMKGLPKAAFRFS